MKSLTNFSNSKEFGNSISKIKYISILFIFMLALVQGTYSQNACAVSGVGPAENGVFPIPVISTCYNNASLMYQSNPLDLTSTFEWSISSSLGFENTSGAFIIGSTTGSTVMVNSGPNSGSFFLVCIASGDTGSQACGLSVAVFKPTVTADPKSVCIGNIISLTGSPQGGVWSGDHVSGSTFDSTGLQAGVYNVTYTYTDINNCTNSANADITVDPPATSNANIDQTICAGSTVTLSGSVGGGASSGTWSTSGTGEFMPNSSTLDAVYTPSLADITAGMVSLTLTTNNPVGPCEAVSDDMLVTIDPPATSNANIDQTICAGSTVTLSGSVGGGASSGTWSTSGTGEFMPNSSTLDAVYTPSLADITAGMVTLTLTTNNPVGLCEAVSDDMLVTIDPPATSNANIDQTICAGSTVTLSGSVGGGASSGTWSSSGTGEFAPNSSTLNAVYTPSLADITEGTVSLTLTTNNPVGPCEAVSDDMLVTIDPPATSNANIDQTICAGSTVTLSGSVGGGASSGTWSSSGTGEFTPNSSTLNAVYTPSLADITAGMVTLTLTTNNPVGPCEAVSDDMLVTIEYCAVEGCTLGYWKNHTNRWCSNYTTCDMFGVVFSGAQSAFPNLTLLQALNLGGGGINNLARQGVAALLNACSNEVDFPAPYLNNPQSVIDAVNAAFLSGGTAPGILASKLDMLNNSGCPLGGTKATSMSNCIEKNSSTIGFETYPVPFKDYITIKYKFDYSSDVKIEIFNSNGVLILSKNDANGYFDKEITLNFNSNNKQFYLVKVTTNRESIIKKILSSK